jgi:NitT/TauT family transport system substrate-binding protein
MKHSPGEKWGAFFILIALLLTACSEISNRPSSETVTLKLAVLSILDSLPMHVAQQEGLFEKHGVVVEFIPVGSAPERDQLISAGQADGMINESMSTIFYNRDQVQVQIVRYARASTAETPLFSILAASKSAIHTVEDLKGIEIGISQGTVIDYLNDRLLAAEGFQPSEVKSVPVPRLDLRMNLLISGELNAAILPEPMTSLAAQQGARVILDDSSHPEYSYSTIAFRKAIIDQHPQAVKAFLAAIEEAVSLINAQPESWETLMSDLKLTPPSLVGSFPVPQFVTAAVPSETQWIDAVNWAMERGLLDKSLSYHDSVRSDFLP